MNIIEDIVIDGRDVSIYEAGKVFIVDVKHPCGELIKGWDGIEDLSTAKSLSELYVFALGNYKKQHCEDEYCIEAFKQQQRA